MKTCITVVRSIQVVDKFQNLGELSDKVKEFSYRVLKEDCLDLPPKTFIKRHIHYTRSKKIYEQMKEQLLHKW